MSEQSPSLTTTVAGVRLSTCVYNASGPRTGSSAALAKIASSESGAVLAKSATLKSQTGNPQPRTWHETTSHIASLNSEGLPNSGIEYYLSPTTIEESIGDSGKPYMVSVSGHTLSDNLKMLEMILGQTDDNKSRIAAVELNLACPNVIRKPIIGYDFDQMESVLAAVCALPAFKKGKGTSTMPLGVKMPPYFDGPHFGTAAKILNQHKDVIRYVASINTIGNAFAIDAISEMPVISSNNGFAGLSGPAVKYTALSNVKKMRELLDPTIDVVGVGGVQTGQDAFELILCGASAVQVGTCHWTEGPKCFDRICSELRGIMREKGYNSIEEFKGQLKPWSKEGASKSRAARKAKEAKADAEKGQIAEKREGTNFYMMLSAILAVVVSILLVDKLGVTVFPSD